MRKTERMNVIVGLTSSLSESVNAYEQAQYDSCGTPYGGLTINPHDSKESIRRRIVCIRDELNLLSKQL